MLSELTRADIVDGRFAEADADAEAILHELAGPAVGDDEVWAVWAAEPPEPVVTASRRDGDRWSLSGRKPWCSGAHRSTQALVTARIDGTSELFAVDLRAPGVNPVPGTWPAVGMARSDSGSVDFDDVTAVRVGGDGEYLSRPGFWHGAIGVAACWFGGALGVADPLYRRCASSPNPHALAHLGSVDAALGAARFALDAAAFEVDADPLDRGGTARARALRTRAIVETAVSETLSRVGRALGAGPLCADGEHSRRVADLTTYVRQSHAEEDLESLGRRVAAEACPW